MARALMFQGTGSDVGKTVLVAGLCRAARNRGLHVLPFKPQNMSNNAAVADPDEAGRGGEIGRAQWLQALACGVAPHVDFNPVLLKPQAGGNAQAVVHGKARFTASAREYQARKRELLGAVMESFGRLCARADLVLVEGAGSPAEINLRAHDIANMGFAAAAGVPVVMVGDIDRGGVIASLVGTHAVLDAADRARIKGYVVNKFRGDVSLFAEGIAAIGRHTGWPGYGVLPFLDAAARLPAEDSVALDRPDRSARGAIRIVALRLPHIANFDEFDALKAEPGVDFAFLPAGERLPADAALVILPGSKSTIADLEALRAAGWEQDLRAHVARGGSVAGICGGYQMLGRGIADPAGVDGPPRTVAGLGLLDVGTVMAGEKTVRNCEAVTADGRRVSGYEIHMGRTEGPDCARAPFSVGGFANGAASADGRVWGCYVHGLFDNDAWRRDVLARLGARAGDGAFRDRTEAALNDIAAAMERHLDVAALLAAAAPVSVSGRQSSFPD